MHRHLTPLLLIVLSLGTPVAIADPAADHVLPTLTVTAEKREGEARRVPASISVLDASQIEEADIDETARVFERAPNIHLTRTGPAASFATFATVRGITSSMGGSPALGFYVDDVYYPGLDIGLQDIERIEVLRGPQGTLYGRNTEAGVINVVTKRPGHVPEARAEAGYGTFDSATLAAMVNGPVAMDNVFARLSARYQHSEGYFETVEGDDEVGAWSRFDGRLGVRLTPTPDLDIDLSLDLQRYPSDHYVGFAPLTASDRRQYIDVDYLGETDKTATGSALRIEQQLDGMRLLSITAARDESFLTDIDADFTAVDLFRLRLEKDVRLYSQELRLLSDRADSPLRWLFGAYLFAEEDARDYRTRLNLGNMGTPLGIGHIRQRSTTDTLGTALFGETSYTFAERLTLTAGLRWDRQTKDFDYRQRADAFTGYVDISGNTDETFTAWLPKFSLSYAFDDDLLGYATVSRGFRSGGFNDNENLGTPYDSEFTTNYEIGLKSTWFDRRLQLDLALFQIDWTERQVEVLTPVGTAFYIENAGEARSRGVELEFFARPTPRLDLSGSVGYTDAELTDYIRAGIDLGGKQVVDAPEHTANLSATYHLDDGWSLNGRFRSVGRIFFDAANTVSQDSYQVIDAKLSHQGARYEIALWGRNLLDEEYVTRAAQGGGNAWYGMAGEPRTIGIEGVWYWD
ncbi:TonB-dependent receptor [Marichromatium bheemlicum]|uniref:TonB-dependent receptor n=1 Tax=Marichromatium bheemlicum TaxID=365339 RepID=A0ABX1IB22_9GAMM|nr:TonB-dependent receptor [Marichromatium bheemlicum]NKN33291.1 TonB-dependent receptor [Marichromatium bheemlicum]